MHSPPIPAPRTNPHPRRRSVILALGSCAAIGAILTGVRLSGDLNTIIHPAPSIESSVKPNAAQSIVIMGMGSRHGDPFYLTGGTYRVIWSAWGPAANFPPCTHSAELLAVDLMNAATTSAHVADLAKFAHVPATGATDERFIANLKPGNYYVDVDSECGWQIALTPSG